MEKQKLPKPTKPEDTVLDKSIYTWMNTFKGLLGQLTPEQTRAYNAVHYAVNEDKHCQRCDANRDWALRHSPIVTFLREQCAGLGGDLSAENIRCRPCRATVLGGFDPDYGIVLCSDQLSTRSRKDVEDTLAHEMVHAYDYLRFKLDRNDKRHAACTEVGRLSLIFSQN
jgi:inner membrane protease ATP23